METLSHNDLFALSHAIGEIYAARDLASFYRIVFRAVHSIIPSELSSCSDVSLHPARFLNIIANSQEHSAVSSRLLPAFNAYLQGHPLVPHCFSGAVHKTTDHAAQSQFKGTDIYNEYYRHLDVELQICFSIPVSEENLALFAMSRKKTDFSESDRLVLTLLKPHLMTAFRNVKELVSLRLERDLLQKGSEKERQGAMLCQSDGRILCISGFAADMIEKYFAAALVEGSMLPESLLQWFKTEAPPLSLDQRRKFAKSPVEQKVERDPLTVVKGDQRLKIKLLHDFTTGDYILLIVEIPTSLLVQKLQGYGLTSRETEVLTWIAEGKSNVVIANILRMSKRTVDKHLEHIFTKLGVENRWAAAAFMRKE